jgi:CHAT domain-containing protein
VFVPDGVLYGIPMAALHDGRGFLGDRYSIAVTPGLSLVAPKPIDRANVHSLLVGLSEAQRGYAPLPHVPEELAGIQAVFGGEVLLDAAFRRDALRERIVEGRPNVVHVASHAEFSGNAESSFLVTHDGALSLEDLHALVATARYGEPMELLTLSACETAAGDDRAALGLSGSAIRAGARSALGTLWTVSDAASELLVTEFYRQLDDPTISKAEALRRAQQRVRQDERFQHPFYWAPYLLISNWL